MLSYSEIERVHIELTTKCNASCPNCPRNFLGSKPHEWILNDEMDLEKFQKYFPPSFLEQIKMITFCGSYGDPSLCTQLIEIIEYTNKYDVEIKINTNGSTRTPIFWRDLANTLNDKSYVIFSIDGLEDTNHFYRQNTSWSKIIENVKAFNEKGLSSWEFLVFKHNEHQKEEAKILATELGFNKIEFKNPFGFSKDNTGLEYMPALDLNGNLVRILFPSSEVSNQNISEIQIKKLTFLFNNVKKRGYSNFSNFPKAEETQLKTNHEIDCYTKKSKEIYVACDGSVFPCCFFSAHYPLSRFSTEWEEDLLQFLGRLKQKNFSLEFKTLKEIIESSYLKDIEKSWFKSSRENGKLEICEQYCSNKNGCYSTLYQKDKA